MIRGIITFRCDQCNNTFKSLDIEWRATAYSQPATCPKCGSMNTYPDGIFPLRYLKKIAYRKIWRIIGDLDR